MNMDNGNTTAHQDILSSLNQQIPLKEKLISAHQVVQAEFPFIVRIAITLYDHSTGMLKTYLHSSGEDNPLDNYQAALDDAPSLKAILDQGLPRVINNLLTLEDGSNEHTRRIGRQGYAASYTLPMFNNGTFMGFIFFNSNEKEVFNEKTLRELDLFGHLISLMVINEIANINTLTAAIKTTGSITHVRDPETGSHLDRMSRYCRLIAQELAGKYELDDDYIEHLFMFSPLHDIGKIGIPDHILLKPKGLNTEERLIMNTHTTIGREMIDRIIDNFALDNLQHIDLLRNIAQYHHEFINGKGYPEGLQGDEIPIEARIVAVADVFDALTSKRPYKEAWDTDKAFEVLDQMSGEKLDTDCVQALINNRERVEAIRTQFLEDLY
jgi:HD-GYP domain-containing protein (c-di-GMP phosphodiesterase class II)